MKTQFKLKQVSLAVGLGLMAIPNASVAEEVNEIEEVVVKASRLQGSAVAVIEERRNQAFVADILGSEQISKTGDSDAASALRRVTGLTLVDGKFIYVRGLGERYSSARLNGASIPSPDLTRNVVPLDIFPSSIIESLSVQKAYSPSMPAAFGGGAIDIRTKSVPKEFLGSIDLGIGYTPGLDSGYSYNRSESGVPAQMQQSIVDYYGDFSLQNIITLDSIKTVDGSTPADQAALINKNLLKSLPRNHSLTKESLDPTYNFKATLGDSYDESFMGGQIGFLASVSYDNGWKSSDKVTAVVQQEISADCTEFLNSVSDIANSCYNTKTESQVTTENERLSGIINLGYKLDKHSVSYAKIYLQDNEDESEISVLESPNGSTINTIVGNGKASRSHEFTYEERELEIDQVIGQHTFIGLPDYINFAEGLGFDWQFTESKATTDIPTDVKYKFLDNFSGGNYVSSGVTGDDNRIMSSFLSLEDHVKSYSGNFTLPIYASGYEIELKAGWDIADKGRYYTTSSFAVNNNSGVLVTAGQGNDDLLNLSGYLSDDFINNNDFYVTFNEPTAPDADDYMAGQKIEAAYGAFDVILNNQYRLSGGVRFEQFNQVSLATSSLIFSQDDFNKFYSTDKLEDGTVAEDDIYSALSFTYLGGEDYQLRFGYGETVVRPDLREVVPVAYFDPLTDIRTIGRVGLKSSPIKNFDIRYEHYSVNGDNLSVAVFYKDIETPIETVLSVGDEDYTATFINGETAEVYGVEAEWLHDLIYVTDGLFTSGNITLSDSEVTIDPAFAGNLTNPQKRLNGHSEYVVNLQLNYDSADGNHSGSFVYNVFGERIIASGVGGREDAFEQPFHSLDLVYTYYPSFNSKIKFKLKNLLDEKQEVTQSDVTVRSKEVGTSYGVTYTYEF